MAQATLKVRPIAGAIGAEIHGVDLASALSEDTVAAIRRAWLEHCVIFFRDQPLPPAQFLCFARRFGAVVEYPFIKGIEGFPEIIPVVKLEHEKTNFGGIWHSDTSYLEKPPMATMLIAREVPPKGGDTMFANTYLAYETLSDGMKHLIEGLIAVNSSRTHPETGRKALYVNVAHTLGFKGMSQAESAPLLNYLIQHQTRPEFTCRFRWEVGSIAFWDNRCTQHNPVNDYHGYRRAMHRITLAGDSPR
jgi:alpha-ketoglutarate-dependent taurine dioxygenase